MSDSDIEDVPLLRRRVLVKKEEPSIVMEKALALEVDRRRMEKKVERGADGGGSGGDNEDDDDVPLMKRRRVNGGVDGDGRRCDAVDDRPLSALRDKMMAMKNEQKMKKEEGKNMKRKKENGKSSPGSGSKRKGDQTKKNGTKKVATKARKKITKRKTSNGKIRAVKLAKEERMMIRSDGDDDEEGHRWWDAQDGSGEIKWKSLEHNGVLFPPEYQPHGVPLLYDGEEMYLEPSAEEVATFYAAKLETDYVKKKTFRKNFFHDFVAVLRKTKDAGKIKSLEKCDFRRIWNHLEAEKAKKKELPPAEKKRRREEDQEKVMKYTVALVDGREEKIGNFRVEPPGLFLGRGEHPLAGKLKKRVSPKDITINIGKNAKVPPCPIEGQKWGKIIHNHTVTWLAMWKDSITNGFKYVWLGAGSAFKGMSDHAKFEKARELKKHIEKIRSDYTKGFSAKERNTRQRSVALYLIDKLALRVGNEKGEDEADTVGCCSLRVEHVKFLEPSTIEFDFLGKDSIRYYNTVEVEKEVFSTMQKFCAGKKPDENIFDELSVSSLNDYLKELMPGLSAKVFRTFNASITLDRLLRNTESRETVVNKLVFYNQQNKEVAILCNHQRSLPKSHDAQMGKLSTRLDDTRKWLRELERGFKSSKSQGGEAVSVTQLVRAKPEVTPEMNDKQRAEARQVAESKKPEKLERKMKMDQLQRTIGQTKERIVKLEAEMQTKDDLKTVALGTSKINYLDPRITVAWCKMFEVPIEKVFAKTLLTKFAWAMETVENFEF